MGKGKRKHMRNGREKGKETPKRDTKRLAVIAVTVLAVLVAAGAVFRWPSPNSRGLVDVTVPASLSAQARSGQRAFDANCARCHGENGAARRVRSPLELREHAASAERNAR